jgi:hypothetical protein
MRLRNVGCSLEARSAVRSLSDLLHILKKLDDAGAGFRSLTEAIDTTTPAGRMMMQMLGAVADDAERAVMQSHTAEVETPHYYGSNSEAINASGALNWPRRKPGGNAACIASNFSDGSTRK